MGLREIFAEPGQTNRIMSLLEYYGTLEPEQFEGEMKKLQATPMAQRMLAMNLLFAQWAEVDPEAALEQSGKLGFPEIFMSRSGMMTGWAASNPEGLAQKYTLNPEKFAMGPGGRGGSQTVSMIAGEWAKQNPEAALKWARTLGEGEVDNAIGGIFAELSQQDPEAALKLSSSLSDTEKRDAYESIAESWAISDYSATDRWINSLSGDDKTMARQAALESLAEVSPARAAKETAKLPAGEARDELVAEVAEEWSRTDSTSAFEFLTESGTPEAVEDGIGRVIGSLANDDAGLALEFIDAQPAGDIRDNAVRGYVYGSREAEPAEKIRLAESISGEESRQQMVTRVANDWARSDPAAAIQYVESSAVIGEESKARIIETAERAAAGEDTGRGFDGPRRRR